MHHDQPPGTVPWIDPADLARIYGEPQPRTVIRREKRRRLGLPAVLALCGIALLAQAAFLTWIGGFR